jgi:hypothetical protein
MATLKLSTVQRIIQDNNSLSASEKDAMLAEANREAAVPSTPVYIVVVLALGLAIFVPLVPVLIIRDSGTAQLLLPIATGALGALAGLLAPSPSPGG